jgi:GDP-L-fucose synthase
MDWSRQRVLLTGGAGFLGSAVRRVLAARGVAPSRLFVVRSRDFDLTRQTAAADLFRRAFDGRPPTVILHCAARLGGIQAHADQPGRFFFDNTAMALSLVDEARRAGFMTKDAGTGGAPAVGAGGGGGSGGSGGVFVMVGSMTSYPADAPVPFREDQLWRGYPEPATAPYAVSKLLAWQLLDSYRAQYGLKSAYVIPVNLFGPGDNIADVRNAHVAGSLVKRFVDAVDAGAGEVVCWGSGKPTRQFLYIDDAAEAVVRAAEFAAGSGERGADHTKPLLPINIAGSEELPIRAVAELIAELTGFTGTITWDTTKPDGVGRRCLDVGRARELLNWTAAVGMREGMERTIVWYRSTRR